MSTAFDTVDHDILLHRLEESFGFACSVLNLVAVFLSPRENAQCSRSSSDFNGLALTVSDVTSGVPHSNVPGPLLFLLYTSDNPVIVSEHGLRIHCSLFLLCLRRTALCFRQGELCRPACIEGDCVVWSTITLFQKYEHSCAVTALQ